LAVLKIGLPLENKTKLLEQFKEFCYTLTFDFANNPNYGGGSTAGKLHSESMSKLHPLSPNHQPLHHHFHNINSIPLCGTLLTRSAVLFIKTKIPLVESLENHEDTLSPSISLFSFLYSFQSLQLIKPST
jgi:hypothetical protein